MVSEDSDQIISEFLAVHRLSDLHDFDQTIDCPMAIRFDQLNAPRKLLEVKTLRTTQRISTEERYYRLYQIRTFVHDVLTKVLFMVVMPLVHEDSADAEEFLELFERAHALRALRHYKPMSHLIAGSVAFSTCPVILPDKADGEAPFSVYKTNNPAKPDQPFLLIARTGRIVTAHTLLYGRVPPDTPGFPAYSQMLTTLLPTWRAANIYLRTVIVTAAIDQRFGRELRLGQSPKLTPFLNVLALGRRQPLYIVFST
jgi:hypothetical protein